MAVRQWRYGNDGAVMGRNWALGICTCVRGMEKNTWYVLEMGGGVR